MMIQKNIEDKLKRAFNPTVLQVVNESHQHNVPPGSESHFKVVIVSDTFAAMRQVKRQQQVYQTLSEELAGEVHALTMVTMTPEEWQKDPSVSESPACMGGSTPSV